MRTFVLLVIVFTVNPAFLFAKTAVPDNEKVLLNDARAYYMRGHYDLAKEKYLELIKINAQLADYHFETGLCIYHSEVNRENSLAYFEKALELDSKNNIPEIMYYCGLASLYSNEIEKAKSYFSKFLPVIDPEKGKDLKKTVTRYIEMCNNAITLTDSGNENKEAFNPLLDLNSVYAEYAPILMNDQSTLLYTARKRGSTGGKKSGDAVYYEDIYIASCIDGKWYNAIKLDSMNKYTDSPINTGRHNAAVSFNSSETRLYLYQDADLYESSLVNGKWTKPVRMNDNLNTREHEPSVFVSPDEKFLLFVSTRDGGSGGRDIYLSEKDANGEWGVAKNLGTEINTPYDDDAPFLSANGQELYFASKGHTSMGGFDIFKSLKNEDGSWGKPENLGIPYNSTADDIYFILTKDPKTQILSSNRKGTLGGMDLYFIREKESTTASDSLPVTASNQVKIDSSQISFNDGITVKDDGTNRESAVHNLEVKPAIFTDNYQQTFAYNRTELAEEDFQYLAFLQTLSYIINQKGIVEIIIESSASRVPTSTFSSNEALALKRANDTKNKIEKWLMGNGFTNEKYKFIIDSKVQGPAYKNDYDTNEDKYSKYQYIQLSIR